MKILFLVPYPFDKAPSQRFRYEQYLPDLEKRGWEYELAPFLDDETWRIIYKPGHTLAKIWGTLKGFFRRLFILFRLGSFDFVFIHREASPIGPPVFEWLIAKVFKKRIIYDFDDAIWMADTAGNNQIVARIKWHDKVNSICKWAYKVSCGNKYLQNYALQFNQAAIIVPTTIDTVNLHNQVKDQHTEKVVIGWTGTHTTLRHLALITPALQRLEQLYDFEFCLISNKAPELELKSLRFIPWVKETEISDLLRFNIGLMPLVDDPWANGKCAFKALQYMSLGIPALVSPVGMNKEVVEHGINGFICQTDEDWFTYLEMLLKDEALRVKLGQAARKRIEDNYSVVSNSGRFQALFS